MTLHTDKAYESELSALRAEMTSMGEFVESMLEDTIRAFSQRDVALARDIAQRDVRVDQMEMKVDEMSVRLLARRQPVASDLRFITATLKMVTDWERIGDLTTNIAERLVELDGGDIPGHFSVLGMASAAKAMVSDVLVAYRREDVTQAKGVLERDHEVDTAYAKLFPLLVEKMVNNPSQISAAQCSQSIAKYLERIADHATNLAEMVTFMVNGRDLRHGAKS